jgi:hypothetical protein
MGIGTGGTGTVTSLTALRVPGSFNPPGGQAALSFAETDADIATINQSIFDDFLNASAPLIGSPMGGFSRNGQLYIPNRGWLKVFPGDVVMVDQNKWPILVSWRSIANTGAPWTTTAT